MLHKKRGKKVYSANSLLAKKKSETIILHLKSDLVTESDKKSKETGEDIECLYTSRLNARLNEDKDIINKLKNNDINDIDDLLKKIDINGDIKIDSKETNKNIHQILSELYEWGSNTDRICWNCVHKFETTPIGIPITVRPQKPIQVRGIFCGFPCMLRYIKDRNMIHCRPNICYLHKILTGTSRLPEIAPVQCALESFGGRLSINEYRQGNEQIYSYVKYPMYIVKDYIHEDEINNIKQSNNYLFKS